MNKKLAAAGLALSLLVCCSPVSGGWFRETGPCYGYGCPGFTSGNSSQPKPSKHQKSKRGHAQPPADQNGAPSSTVSR
jgi:hypothetical protein